MMVFVLVIFVLIVMNGCIKMGSQNIYQYQKITLLDSKLFKPTQRKLVNKINEIIIKQNTIEKDFELYKKAYQDLATEDSNKKSWANYDDPRIDVNKLIGWSD